MALGAVFWLPLVAVAVLLGFAVGFWIVGIGVAVIAVMLVVLYVRASETRRAPPMSRDEVNAELRRLDREFIKWFKWYGIIMGGCLGFLTLLVLVSLVVHRLVD